jgi:hypothetical protein
MFSMYDVCTLREISKKQENLRQNFKPFLRKKNSRYIKYLFDINMLMLWVYEFCRLFGALSERIHNSIGKYLYLHYILYKRTTV